MTIDDKKHDKIIIGRSAEDIEAINNRRTTEEGVRQREARRACEDAALARRLGINVEDFKC